MKKIVDKRFAKNSYLLPKITLALLELDHEN